MRFLVCGGENWHDKAAAFAALDRVHATRQITFLIMGGSADVDFLAWLWANAHDIASGTFPADWKANGKAACPIRNQKMIDKGKPDAVIAFPSTGPGTADMVARAETAGFPVYFPYGRNSVTALAAASPAPQP